MADPCNLIVNYIPTPVKDQDIRDLFAQYGELLSARVIVDHVTGTPRGYGFVKFRDPNCARAAMLALDGTKMFNKRLRVSVASGWSRGANDQQPQPSQQQAPSQQQQQQHHQQAPAYSQQQPPPPQYGQVASALPPGYQPAPQPFTVIQRPAGGGGGAPLQMIALQAPGQQIPYHPHQQHIVYTQVPTTAGGGGGDVQQQQQPQIVYTAGPAQQATAATSTPPSAVAQHFTVPPGMMLVPAPGPPLTAGQPTGAATAASATVAPAIVSLPVAAAGAGASTTSTTTSGGGVESETTSNALSS